jgi:hypothetical protein
MADETSPNPPDPTPDKSALQKKCDDEFDWYENERPILTKAEIEAEKNYDTLLVTLSTLAIGSSFVVMKDVVRSPSASAFIVLAWCAFGLCLFVALVDRLLSYWTHLCWRKIIDKEFSPWREGARERALSAYPGIRFIWLLPWLKWVGFGLLLVGMLFLMAFVFVGTGTTAAEPKPQTPIVVNVYNGSPPTTAPATRASP